MPLLLDYDNDGEMKIAKLLKITRMWQLIFLNCCENKKLIQIRLRQFH